MNIRRMEKKDSVQVADIEMQNFSVPWSEKSFLEAVEKENNIYIVAEENDQILGYVGGWSIFGELNITNVCVDSQHRRRGIAEKLLQYMIAEARKEKCDIFFLEVRESNVAAIRLYEKMNFQKIGIRKNFYEKPVENGVVMSLTFS